MMSLYRTMVLSAAGAVLAGCVATAPQRPGVAGPEAPGAAAGTASAAAVGTAAGDAREVVVEAEGIAHMGDKDRREDVEARAEWEAIEQAARKAFGLHVQEIVETEVGILIRDTNTRTVVGTFTSVSRIDEDFDGSRYRIRVRAEGRRESPGAEASGLPGNASPGGREPAAETEAAPPAPSTEPPAGRASVPVSRAGVTPSAGQAKIAKAKAAPAAPGGAVAPSRSRDAVTVCCRGFPRTLVRRVRDARSVLAGARGILRVEEVRVTDTDLCYRIHHDGSPEPIDEWIEQLRTDAALPFKRRYDRRAGTIELVFDAGFD